MPRSLFWKKPQRKLGFLSLSFRQARGYDLTNEQLWTIQLKANDRNHKPVLIRKLDQKARWTPFFPAVHTWSDEYLVLFDDPLPVC